jgi:endo-1,4-beta-D-glucanase Y
MLRTSQTFILLIALVLSALLTATAEAVAHAADCTLAALYNQPLFIRDGLPSPRAPTAPKFPFPQHVQYAAGTIKPNHRCQTQLDDDVRAFYAYWKRNYVVSAGTNGAGQQMYRIAFGHPRKQPEEFSATVSEGQGYGMVIMALMAGHDPHAQTIFDGFWYYSRAFPSGMDNRLMSWKIDNGQIVEGNGSAFDGDADIAYGLLLADAQWGSAGQINYKAEANTVITGILASTIGPDSSLPMLGDWTEPNGNSYSQYTPRSSDLMVSHFRAYRWVHNFTRWNSVIIASQEVIASLQQQHSPATGLLPDFIVNANATPQPAPPDFLEGPHDGHYHYNAGRVPWRIGLDALLNNDPVSKAQTQKMSHWIETAAGGNPQNIKAGYQLDGTPIGNYFTTFFAAPFGVAAMTNPDQQQWLNAIYDSVYDRQEEGYYEDTVTLLALLVMTGNFWDPTHPPCSVQRHQWRKKYRAFWPTCSSLRR